MNAFWSADPDAVLAEQASGPAGLATDEAARRLAAIGAEARLRPRRRGFVRILTAQFLNPLVLLLLVAAVVSVPAGSVEDALVILAIVLLSGGLGFVQEFVAEDAVAKLLSMVRARATIRRDGKGWRSPSTRSCPATWSSSPRVRRSRGMPGSSR